MKRVILEHKTVKFSNHTCIEIFIFKFSAVL